jgi:hypothetical protein
VEHINATAPIDESMLGPFADARSCSHTMLMDRDFKWCAETMLSEFGSTALGRAERRARKLLRDGNRDGYDIWTGVAATIREVQANVRAAE